MKQVVFIHKSYLRFLSSTPKKEGICAGMSLHWLTESLAELVSEKNNGVSHFRLSERNAFYNVAKSVQQTEISFINSPERPQLISTLNKQSKWLRKKEKLPAIVYSSVTQSTAKLYIDLFTNKIQQNKGKGLTVFVQGHKTLHAVSFLCDGNNVWFFEPGNGVYLLEENDSWRTIEHYLNKLSRDNLWMCSGAEHIFAELKSKKNIQPFNVEIME